MTLPANPAEWTVLIVDDDTDNIEVAVQFFRFMDAEVHVASNGEEGLELLTDLDPTLILLDLSMPVMDGWTMLDRIRRTEGGEDVSVIALTAHAMDGDRERVLEAGFDGYIAKPYHMKTLLDDINAALEEGYTYG